jgi:hypothetical protein
MVAVIKSTNGTAYKVVRTQGVGTFGTFTISEYCSAPPNAGSATVYSKHAQCFLKRAPLARHPLKTRFFSIQELALKQQHGHRNLMSDMDARLEGNHTARMAVEASGGSNLSDLLASRKHVYMPESEIRLMFVQVCFPDHVLSLRALSPCVEPPRSLTMC